MNIGFRLYFFLLLFREAFMKYCRVITLFHYGFVTYTCLFWIF